MEDVVHEQPGEIGQRIREYRTRKRYTMKQVAQAAGVTPGFLSQVENNRVAPSIDSLRRIAQALEVPVFHLLIDDTAPDEVVRASERRRLQIPGRGLEYEIVSAALGRDFGILEGELAPGEHSADGYNTHPGEECIVVRRGKLLIEMPYATHELLEDDGVYFDSGLPHRLYNPTDRPCIFWLILSPPRF